MQKYIQELKKQLEEIKSKLEQVGLKEEDINKDIKSNFIDYLIRFLNYIEESLFDFSNTIEEINNLENQEKLKNIFIEQSGLILC